LAVDDEQELEFDRKLLFLPPVDFIVMLLFNLGFLSLENDDLND